MLEGLKVVELATWVAGPSAATVMGDWGADVIKVESRTGDPTRDIFESMPELKGSPVFEFENRSKRGVVLDIGKPEGRAALLRLLAEADVFITNLRPGGLKRAKIDYETIKAELPKLIYCSISGYGLRGDHIDLPAFDIAALWTRSGMAGAVIPEGVDPFPCRPGMGDSICALSTVSAALAAVVERGRTGHGRLVETSLARTGVYAIGWDLSVQLKFGIFNQTKTRDNAINPTHNYFKSSDGFWFCCMMRAVTDWPKIAEAAKRPELVDDPRFAEREDRLENNLELIKIMDEAFNAMPMEEVAERLTKVDVIWAPLQSPEQVIEDPYAQQAGCFVEITDAAGDTYKTPASPARFPGADDGPKRPAPILGQHTREVLAEIGYSKDEIERLIEAGSASTPESLEKAAEAAI